MSSKCTSSVESCFFCGKLVSTGKPLQSKVSTLEVDTKVWQCAIKLQDKQLLAKISPGDLIAQDDQNHVQLVSLYNRARENKRADDSNSDEVNHDIAFTELETYIENACIDDLIAPVFKLNDLVSL